MEPFSEFQKKHKKIQQGALERRTPEHRIGSTFAREMTAAETKRLLGKVAKSKAKEQELYARVQAHPLAKVRAEKLANRTRSTNYQTGIGAAAGGIVGGLYGAYGGGAAAVVRDKVEPSQVGKSVLVGTGIGAAAGAAIGGGLNRMGHKIMKKDTPRTLEYSARYHAAKKADPKKLRNRVRYGIQRAGKRLFGEEEREELIAAIIEVLS